MASIVVCGGSVIGLSVAMMLARDGHDVTVLEADPAPVPDVPSEAWDGWRRQGVAQFHQPHNFFPRIRQILATELPELNDLLLAAGCVWVDPMATLPPGITDTAPRPNDDRFRFITGRRPVGEAVFAIAAANEPRVDVRRGITVAGLHTGAQAADGVPHVDGVVTDTDEVVAADLVVDAMGRRTPSADLLAAVGARTPITQSEDCGFIYYTRYFTGPECPVQLGPVLAPHGSISVLTLPGDNDTWSVTMFTATGDAPLKTMRDNDVFTRIGRALPLKAHWLDGKPITNVLPMAGVLDKYRRFVVDGAPVATGFLAVGDAWACTNPSAGRGISVGLVHTQLLRRVIRESLDDGPEVLARRWDEETETHVAPFYWNQIADDRARVAEMLALRDGTELPAPDPHVQRFMAALTLDADVFRAAIEMLTCLALPEEVFARPGFVDRLARYDDAEPMRLPGPDRAQLMELLAA
jgi:2-polyprenyl-6-methoxyphenol hydroxylase-like FAD-dependent oxidoreductase